MNNENPLRGNCIKAPLKLNTQMIQIKPMNRITYQDKVHFGRAGSVEVKQPTYAEIHSFESKTMSFSAAGRGTLTELRCRFPLKLTQINGFRKALFVRVCVCESVFVGQGFQFFGVFREVLRETGDKVRCNHPPLTDTRIRT